MSLASGWWMLVGCELVMRHEKEITIGFEF
jgi:hypothetical protein